MHLECQGIDDEFASSFHKMTTKTHKKMNIIVEYQGTMFCFSEKLEIMPSLGFSENGVCT